MGAAVPNGNSEWSGWLGTTVQAWLPGAHE